MRRFRESGYVLEMEGVTFRLAREFGFCYGVERAVDYAYETVRRFPGRRIVLTGEIIHNPKVNDRLRSLGIRFLGGPEVPDLAALGARGRGDRPGVRGPGRGLRRARDERRGGRGHDLRVGAQRLEERRALRARGADLHRPREVATTRRRGRRCPGSRSRRRAAYLVVLDLEEAELVARHVREGGAGGTTDPRRPRGFLARFAGRTSEGFDPDRHLERVGMANQTTMLSGESLAIARGDPAGASWTRYGEAEGRGAVPVVRHDLLGHPGAAGRAPRRWSRNRSTSCS